MRTAILAVFYYMKSRLDAGTAIYCMLSKTTEVVLHETVYTNRKDIIQSQVP